LAYVNLETRPSSSIKDTELIVFDYIILPTGVSETVLEIMLVGVTILLFAIAGVFLKKYIDHLRKESTKEEYRENGLSDEVDPTTVTDNDKNKLKTAFKKGL
jgi:hypothetical protein